MFYVEAIPKKEKNMMYNSIDERIEDNTPIRFKAFKAKKEMNEEFLKWCERRTYLTNKKLEHGRWNKIPRTDEINSKFTIEEIRTLQDGIHYAQEANGVKIYNSEFEKELVEKWSEFVRPIPAWKKIDYAGGWVELGFAHEKNYCGGITFRVKYTKYHKKGSLVLGASWNAFNIIKKEYNTKSSDGGKIKSETRWSEGNEKKFYKSNKPHEAFDRYGIEILYVIPGKKNSLCGHRGTAQHLKDTLKENGWKSKELTKMKKADCIKALLKL